MKNTLFVLLISMLFLSGCSGDRCIDADDFGFIKFAVSSRYPQEDLSSQQQYNQVAPWLSSGYNVNGQPLTMIVKSWNYRDGDRNNSSELSAWSPWYGQANNTDNLSEFSLRLQNCKFIDDKMCTSTKDARIENAPCLFKDGVGLYFLIAERGIDPNSSFTSQRDPAGITRHVGEPTPGFELYDLNKRGERVRVGGINFQLNSQEKIQYAQCPLYFKILDKFYDDNNGQYRVVIKSGVSDTRDDPLEFLSNLVKGVLFGDDKHKGIVRGTFDNLISNPGYRIAVSALLTLYIMFTGFSFLIGNVNLTHTELIVRIAKVSVVSMLLSSTGSWEFFHDYLFVYFVEGVDQILQIIKDVSASGPGSSSIIGLMIAPETMAKLFSLLFVDPLGFIYIILFLIALYFIFMMFFEATIIYLTALISIGMIITMGPIFVCFMLFGITRSLFENWLRQLMSYAIQPIILFTGLAFISMIIRTEIYSSLGFGICKFDFPKLASITTLFGSDTEYLDPSIESSIFYWWFPNPMKSSGFTKQKASILVPVDHRVDDGSPDGKLCLAYECVEERYVELPFLDPVEDKDRIDDFFAGNFVQLYQLFLIFVCVYLLSKFNDTAVSVAKFLTGTSGNLTNLQNIGFNAYSGIKQPVTSYVGKQVQKPINYVDEKLGVSRFVKQGLHSIDKGYENLMLSGVRREALNSPTSSVLNEVKRTHGIDFKDVNKDAAVDYHSALKDYIEANPTASGKKVDANKMLNELEGKSYKDIRDELSMEFKGKKFQDLTKEEQKEFENSLKNKDGKSIRELLSDKKYTEDYVGAYTQAHQAMSQRGVGLFGKNIAPLRSWQEMNNRIDAKKKLRDDKRRAIGEKIYAGYEGIKRTALTAVVGKDLRDAYEGNLTGAEWHDFMYDDPRLRTYAEQLKDDQRAIEQGELRSKINKETLATGQDISSPAYLQHLEEQGRTADAEYYKQLSKQSLAFQVYESLSNGEEPALMGERFMREKATDNQTHEMIDSARRIEQELIENDRYIRRQDHYEIMREKADSHIQHNIDKLKEKYPDITKEQVPDLLTRYYTERDGRISDEAKKEIDDAKSSIRNLQYSEGVLAKIEERKKMIKDEVSGYVNQINQHRLAAGMAKYDK